MPLRQEPHHEPLSQKTLTTVINIILNYIEDNKDDRKYISSDKFNKVSQKTSLHKLHFDKIDIQQVSMDIEQYFNIEIPQSSIDSFKNIDDIYMAVAKAINKKNFKLLASTLTPESITQEIIQIIKDNNSRLRQTNIISSTDLFKDLECGELEFVSILYDFQQKHKVDFTLPIESCANFKEEQGYTIADITDYFYRYIKQASSDTVPSEKQKILQQGTSKLKNKSCKISHLFEQIKQKLTNQKQ